MRTNTTPQSCASCGECVALAETDLCWHCEEELHEQEEAEAEQLAAHRRAYRTWLAQRTPAPRIGDVVHYFGTLTRCHGLARVISVRPAGYKLSLPDGTYLRNVRRLSIAQHRGEYCTDCIWGPPGAPEAWLRAEHTRAVARDAEVDFDEDAYLNRPQPA